MSNASFFPFFTHLYHDLGFLLIAGIEEEDKKLSL